MDEAFLYTLIFVKIDHSISARLTRELAAVCGSLLQQERSGARNHRFFIAGNYENPDSSFG